MCQNFTQKNWRSLLRLEYSAGRSLAMRCSAYDLRCIEWRQRTNFTAPGCTLSRADWSIGASGTTLEYTADSSQPPLATVWCSEIGSLTSLDAPELSDVSEPISLHQAVQQQVFGVSRSRTPRRTSKIWYCEKGLCVWKQAVFRLSNSRQKKTKTATFWQSTKRSEMHGRKHDSLLNEKIKIWKAHQQNKKNSLKCRRSAWQQHLSGQPALVRRY